LCLCESARACGVYMHCRNWALLFIISNIIGGNVNHVVQSFAGLPLVKPVFFVFECLLSLSCEAWLCDSFDESCEMLTPAV